MIRLVLLMFFLSLTLGLSSQSETPSDQELLNYIEVFILKSKYLESQEAETKRILAESDMSEERYGAILRAQFTGDIIEYSSQELTVLEQLKSQKLNFNQEKNDQLKALCVEHDITLDRYQAIARLQQTDQRTKSKLISILQQRVKQD